MNPGGWLEAISAPFAGWLGARSAPPPVWTSSAPPAPLFGARFKHSIHPAGAGTVSDPATRVVERSHELALGYAELSDQERRTRAQPLIASLRDVARSHAEPTAAGLFRPALALAWGGRLFEGEEAGRWTKEAAVRWTAALERGVAQDGVVLGGGVREHLVALSDALESRALLADGSLDPCDERLEPLVQVAADLRTPGRREVDVPGAPQCVAAWQRLTGRRLESRESFALEASGLYGVRAERSLALIDTGAWGRRAALGLEWTVDGRRILVSEGVELPEGEPKSGELLVLDGRSIGRARGPRVERTRLEQLGHTLVLETAHHNYSGLRGRPVHRRRVTASAHGLAVEDIVSGGAGQAVVGAVVLDPQVDVRRRGASLVLVAGPVTALFESRAEVELENAWWLGEDGEWRSTSRIVLRYGSAPCGGSFRIDRLLPGNTLTSFLRRESIALERHASERRASA
jgi:Heparinase II/III-like protein